MLPRWLPPLASILVTVACAREASADIAPEGTGCYQKKAGDACIAYWKIPTGGMPTGQQGPGRCVDVTLEGSREPIRAVTCQPFAAPGIAGVTYADGQCAGRREGEACASFNEPFDGKGGPGACTVKSHPDHGKILACDKTRVATVTSAASSASAAPSAPSAPSAPASAAPAATAAAAPGKGCGCAVPGGVEPAAGVGMAALGLLALGGRRTRAARREG